MLQVCKDLLKFLEQQVLRSRACGGKLWSIARRSKLSNIARGCHVNIGYAAIAGFAALLKTAGRDAPVRKAVRKAGFELRSHRKS